MSAETAVALPVDRDAAMAWYRRNRERSRAIFDLIDPAAYYTRPIALRNPIVFYEGHLPAFSVIAFLRRGLGRPPVNARLEELFARGIDPDSVDAAAPRSGAATVWPARDEVLAFGAAVDEAVLDALAHARFVEDRPAMRRAQGLFTALEHEAMHQETLLYMWHRLPYEQKHQPSGSGVLPPEGGSHEMDAWLPPSGGRASARRTSGGTVRIPAGGATLGADPDRIPFGWDNEFDAHDVHVPAFEIDVHNVTNGAFLEFMHAGGYGERRWWTDADWTWVQQEGRTAPNFWTGEPGNWQWRGMFAARPLPLEAPVYVSQAEASAYARWKGRRLPTEAEWHRAAAFPEAPGELPPGNYDFRSWDPVPVGSYAPNALGVHDLVGNGWEWTTTVFTPFPGFAAMAAYPEYSAEFFDGAHYVMKGASPATARELVRPSFRNWFRPNYPYVYATFRTVK